MVKAGFPVANTGQTFPGLRTTRSVRAAGSGQRRQRLHRPGSRAPALDCLVKGQNCGGYSLRGGTSPAFRGLMTWSINWDRYYNWEFQNSHAPYLAALP